MVKLIKGESDLATLHPDLVKEWHPIKNGDLMPEDISSGSGKEVWWLCPEGHTYSMVVNQRTKRGYDEMYNSLYDLIISDIMMPEVDGFEFAENVRKVNRHIPILFMSARDDLPAKQKGFRIGIDDYMVKPVELAELEMRVRALLRRANIETERKLTVGNLVMDADAMTAMIDNEEIAVTTREFNILYKLLSYPNKTFSRAQLMDEFWGVETDTSLRAVDVYITKLRDKFSDCDGFEIKTVRGLGYKVVLK